MNIQRKRTSPIYELFWFPAILVMSATLETHFRNDLVISTMKVITIRWKTCLAVSCVLIYLLATLIFFGMDVSKIEPVAPRRTKLIEKTLTRPKVKATVVKPVITQSTTRTQSTSWKESMMNPHIKPRFLFKGGRKDVKFVIGVPTVLRPRRNYVLETIDLLIRRMTPRERDLCLIVLYVGETNPQFGKFLVKNLLASHKEQLEAGLIDVIAPHLHYYPNFSQLHITLHDDPQRVRWRTKQNLDYIYLMSYARPKGSFYLQLEDDVMPNEGFLDYIQKTALMHGVFRFDHQLDWIVMSFSDLGFIGKLFPSSVLRSFVIYLQLFCNDQPIDWLLQSFVTLQSCRWDSISHPDCQREFEARIIRVGQSQFQHMGQESSLSEKTQNQKDKFFNRNMGSQRFAHLRQPLNLVASHRNALLRQNLDLQPGETFIWIYMPQMPKMMRHLITDQYRKKQFRIRNNKETSKNLPEFDVQLVKKLPGLDVNSSENELCGFVMSHTIFGEEEEKESADTLPYNYMFYYIREHSEDTISWFRRFFWVNATGASASPCFGLNWILVLLGLVGSLLS